MYYAADAFVHNDELGKNVVIIGGSKVGTEAGLLLAQKGHNATVVEMRGELAADATKIHYRAMFRDVWEAEPNFHSVCNATVTAVSRSPTIARAGRKSPCPPTVSSSPLAWEPGVRRPWTSMARRLASI